MPFIQDFIGWLGWVSHDDGDGSPQTMTDTHHSCSGDINPANGMPMVGCNFDIEGNPFGFDLHHHDTWTTSSSMDDPFPSYPSSWPD